jgi:hypothetical protein
VPECSIGYIANHHSQTSAATAIPSGVQRRLRGLGHTTKGAIVFLLIFLTGLGFIFVSPFYGVLLLYAFSFGNFHTLTWGGLGDLYLAYVIVVLTGISWLLSSTEKKRVPLTPLVVLTLLFSLWITVTSYFALAPAALV